jgi:cyclin T
MMTMMCVDVQNVYKVKKEKVLLGERLVLITLDFDINVQHSYKHLVVAIRKFQVATNTLVQVTWNFMNDG